MGQSKGVQRMCQRDGGNDAMSAWSVWSLAKSERSARKVHKWLEGRLERETAAVSFEPYPKTGGWMFTFRVPLAGETHGERVVELIAFGQRVGRGWILSGDVYGDLSGWSSEPIVSGIQAIEWQMAEGRE
jgi:hypothetical protein